MIDTNPQLEMENSFENGLQIFVPGQPGVDQYD